MTRYIILRIVQAVVLLKLVLVSVFFLLHLTGDPALVLMPEDATREEVDAFRRQMGFDDPLWVQYGRFFWNVLHGHFGDSFEHKVPAMGLVLEHMPATLELALAAYLFAILVAFPAGLLSAAKGRESVWERVCLLGTALAQSLPAFWFGLMLILFLSVGLGLLPPFGRGSVWHLIMPAVATSAYMAGRLTRLIRSGMLEVLGQDYIVAARSKGLPEFWVVAVHGLRNASLPLVTVMGTDLGVLLHGTVVIEVVFAWPGVGLLAVQAIYHRDFVVVQATVFLMAAFFVFVNLIVDLMYGFLDPRVRISGS